MSTSTASIISITPSRRKFASNKDNEFHVAVKLTAPSIALSKRQPTAIAVALDISGSMAEETGIRFPGEPQHWEGFGFRGRRSMSKLDVAKQALEKLIENLTSQDYFSLVSFHDFVATEFAQRLMTDINKRVAIDVVRRIQTRGNTNLAGGLYAAIDQIKTTSPVVTQRVMLFTDGAANVGAQRIDEIEREMISRFRNEIPGISTFGIGKAYNGELLGSLARGGGAHYYIDNAERIGTAFGTELGTLASIYAKDVELKIRPAEKTEIVEILNQLPTTNGVLGAKTIKCDDLYSEQSYNVVFLVKVPKCVKTSKTFPVLTVEGKLKDVATGGTLSFTERLEITLGSAKSADKSDDPEVASAVALQLAARSQREAMDAARRGDFAQARQVLSMSADVMKGMGRGDLAAVNNDLMTRGYASETMYRNEGSKLSSSLGLSYSRQTAGMGGTKVGGVDVDALLSNSAQKKMANAFSITKVATPDDQMPDVESMITSR